MSRTMKWMWLAVAIGALLAVALGLWLPSHLPTVPFVYYGV